LEKRKKTLGPLGPGLSYFSGDDLLEGLAEDAFEDPAEVEADARKGGCAVG